MKSTIIWYIRRAMHRVRGIGFQLLIVIAMVTLSVFLWYGRLQRRTPINIERQKARHTEKITWQELNERLCEFRWL